LLASTAMVGTNTTTTTPRLPEPVESVAATERVREGGSERRGFVGLDRNERVGPLPDWFVNKLRASIDSNLLMTYPNVDDLDTELAAATGLAPERLLVTPGNDPAIKALYQAFVRPGDAIVTLDPSYAMYVVYARLFGTAPVTVGYNTDLELDVERLLATVVPGVKVVFVANPNQPTGTIVGGDVLRALLARAADAGAIVMVDEAYTYFAPSTSALPLVEEHPNLLVARSFSKAGFAGVRIGFVAGSTEVVGALFKVRSAAEVNAIAILCARLLLAHPEIGEEYAAEVEAGRAVLEARARSLGLTPLPSHANFTQLRVPDGLDPAAIVAGLHVRGWLIKGPFREPCLAGCVRVTLGPPALMEEFCEVLADVVATVT
jgi:histidinol-phosphate aminotransferase